MGKTHENIKDKKWMYQKYIEERKNISEIAIELFGKEKSRITIHRWLKKHKIKLRPSYGSDLQVANFHKGVKKAWFLKKGSGKRYMYRDGYKFLYLPNDKSSNKKGYKAEHRVVMEKVIGRKLNKKEIVHHKNKIRDDNRPENLMLIEIGKPNAHEICCPVCNFKWMIK